MNESRRMVINQKVLEYFKYKDPVAFESCYTELIKEYKSWISYNNKNTYMANEHDILELFDDTVINVLKEVEEKGGDFVKLFQLRLTSRYKSLLRKLILRREKEKYIVSDSNNSEEEAATFEIADDYRFEEHIDGKQKDDQRQLIDFLVRGENERTTAIVQAFLNHPKPNATAIAKVVGLDHKQVSRALTRLASKFDSKQFGSHRDYLVAL